MQSLIIKNTLRLSSRPTYFPSLVGRSFLGASSHSAFRLFSNANPPLTTGLADVGEIFKTDYVVEFE